jgi:hypothetical protein
VQLESDCVVAVPGKALARSLDDLAVAGEDPARSVVEMVQRHALPSIDNAIDQLTADLAAFCFDHWERSVKLGDEVGGTHDFEDELQVILESQRTYQILMLD